MSVTVNLDGCEFGFCFVFLKCGAGRHVPQGRERSTEENKQIWRMDCFP